MKQRRVAILLFLLMAVGVGAAEREILPMDNQLLTALGEAQKLMNGGNLDAAIERAQAVAPEGFNATEKGQLFNFIALALFQRGDRSDAIGFFEDVLTHARHVPATIEFNARFNLAQLYYLKKHYAKSIQAMEDLRQSGANVTAQQIFFQGQVHYQAEQYGQAADTIAEAIAMVTEQGSPVPDAWSTLERHAALRR